MLDLDLSKGNVSRWKKDLSGKEIEYVERELGDVMEKYGYLE